MRKIYEVGKNVECVFTKEGEKIKTELVFTYQRRNGKAITIIPCESPEVLNLGQAKKVYKRFMTITY